MHSSDLLNSTISSRDQTGSYSWLPVFCEYLYIQAEFSLGNGSHVVEFYIFVRFDNKLN